MLTWQSVVVESNIVEVEVVVVTLPISSSTALALENVCLFEVL